MDKVITTINASLSKTSQITLVSSYLSVERTFWKKEWVGGRMRRTPHTYETPLVTRKGVFLAGWNERVAKFLKNEYNMECYLPQPKIQWRTKFNLKFDKVTLTDYQKTFVEAALQKRRGIVKSATGSGKTIMEGAILASYPKKARKLVLCHSKKLLHQLADKLEQHYGFYVTKVGDGYNDLGGDVIVAIINSWALQPQEVLESIHIVVVDEAHHVNSESSVYFNTLLKMTNAWYRFGFTATLPSTKEGRLICEGVFGKVVANLSIETAVKLGMFAKVKVILLDAPIVETESTRYADLYKERIIHNDKRNSIIMEEVEKVNAEGESCLIYIKELAHGRLLQKSIPNSVFVSGSVSGKEQEIISDKLDKKKIMNVIATTTWKEGVDIPSLNNIFNGAGGKSEIAVIQNVGRGARTTKEKTSMKVFDFIDHGKFLEGHTCDRLSIYAKNKWL